MASRGKDKLWTERESLNAMVEEDKESSTEYLKESQKESPLLKDTKNRE